MSAIGGAGEITCGPAGRSGGMSALNGDYFFCFDGS